MENLLPHYQNSDETDFVAKPKKFNKFYFRDICKRLRIINEKHYQERLKSEIELQECKLYMNPSQVEGYKKLIFAHNFKAVTLDFERPRIHKIRDRNRLGISCRFIKTIALENNTYFAKLNIPLKHRVNAEDFRFLADSGKEFIYLLTREDIGFTDSVITCSRDYTKIYTKPHLSQSQRYWFI